MELGNIDASVFGLRCKERGGFYYFVQQFWHTVCTERPVWNWHIKYECDIWEEMIFRVAQIGKWGKNSYGEWEMLGIEKDREKKLYDYVLNVPPGTSKSTICSQMGFVWAWTIDPTLRILGCSYSEELAFKNAMKRRDIMTSAKFLGWFPDVRIRPDMNSQKLMQNEHGGIFSALGLGGTITGNHFHLIVPDDPNNANDSETELRSANEAFDNLSTRKTDSEISVTWTIQQRLHEIDVTGHVLDKKKNIFHICLPAEESDKIRPIELASRYVDGLLDPKRLNRAVLAEKMEDLKNVRYNAQFLQRPAPADGLIWKVEYFKVVDDVNMPKIEDLSLLGTDWDTAETSNNQNAASAWVTAGRINFDVFIMDIGFIWCEFPKLLETMRSKPSPHYIEGKSSGKSAIKTLLNSGITAIEVKVTGGEDKVKRANDAVPIAAAGCVYIKRSLIDKLFNDPKQGILNFPNGRYKDLADALAQSLQRLSNGWNRKNKMYINTSETVKDYVPPTSSSGKRKSSMRIFSVGK